MQDDGPDHDVKMLYAMSGVEPPTTEMWQRTRRQFKARDQGGICGECDRELAEGEPVWIVSYYAGVSPGRQSQYLLGAFCQECLPQWKETWQPRPCQSCGRPIHHEVDRRWRKHALCSQVCRINWHNAQVLERAAEQRAKVCVVCGKHFTATRRDAVVCSSSCRQKAYRQRHAT